MVIMKKITVLHLDDCPYCHNAKRAMEDLRATNPDYAKLIIEWIEESRQPELATAYAKDYYYVPSVFVDGEKIYEAHPGESYEECYAAVEKAFKVACS